MDKMIAHFKKTWKVYLMGIWMIGTSGYLFYLGEQIKTLNQINGKLISDVDSIESVLIGADGNISQMKETLIDMNGKMETVYRRVMRKR